MDLSVDQKIEAIAIVYFDTREHILECLKRTTSQTRGNFANTLNIIFAKVPANIAEICVYSEKNDSRSNIDLFSLLKDQTDHKLIIATMRIFARKQSSMEILSKLYDLFFEMFGTEELSKYDAWRIIEIGIAERHILYDNEIIYNENSELISTFERYTDYFQQKEWVPGFARPPAISGYAFMTTVIMTRFGLIISRDLFTSGTMEIYAKDKRIKKILGTRSNQDTIKILAELAAAAIGMYSKHPLNVYESTIQKYDHEGLLKDNMESYKAYNIALLHSSD